MEIWKLASRSFLAAIQRNISAVGIGALAESTLKQRRVEASQLAAKGLIDGIDFILPVDVQNSPKDINEATLPPKNKHFMCKKLQKPRLLQALARLCLVSLRFREGHLLQMEPVGAAFPLGKIWDSVVGGDTHILLAFALAAFSLCTESPLELLSSRIKPP